MLYVGWTRRDVHVLSIFGSWVTYIQIRVRLMSVLSLQVLQRMVMLTRGVHGNTHISKAYRNEWWAFQAEPQIIMVRIITVISVNSVVWTMVRSNIICVWLMHSRSIINAC